MSFDNRHTIASRRTVLPPAAANSRTFSKGIALGVIVGAVSATLTYATLFSGPNRTTSLIASAAAVTPKPAPGTAARPDAAGERGTPAPAAAATINETKNEPGPCDKPDGKCSQLVATNSPATAAASEVTGASPEVKPEVQREESRPRHRRERHTARRERPRNPPGWYVDAGANQYGRPYSRGRSEWSW
jgi:hypothetical protein